MAIRLLAVHEIDPHSHRHWDSQVTDYKPMLTTANWISIWAVVLGTLLAGLSRGNDIENQQIKTDTQQQAIIKQQAEIKSDVKDARKEQQVIKELLIQIKANQEK